MASSAERMRRLRRRRAAERARLRDPATVDAASLLLPAIDTSLAALDLGERDQAMAQLARLYAAQIDGRADQFYALRHYGPLLLQALTALHATPLSQAAAKADHAALHAARGRC